METPMVARWWRLDAVPGLSRPRRRQARLGRPRPAPVGARPTRSPRAPDPAPRLSNPRILSSPAARCLLTVEPLAQRRGLPIEPAQVLGVDADPAYLVALLLDPAVDAAVLCSHGDLIRTVLERLVGHDLDDAVELAWPKRSTW